MVHHKLLERKINSIVKYDVYYGSYLEPINTNSKTQYKNNTYLVCYKDKSNKFNNRTHEINNN